MAVATGRPTGFAGADPPPAWPPTPYRPRPERLARAVDSIKGVGPGLAKKLAKLGLGTLGDLVDHAPRGYQRPLEEKRIADLQPEQEAAIACTVRSTSLRRVRRRLTILKAVVADDSGPITAVWFNQEWLEARLRPGTHV